MACLNSHGTPPPTRVFSNSSRKRKHPEGEAEGAEGGVGAAQYPSTLQRVLKGLQIALLQPVCPQTPPHPNPQHTSQMPLARPFFPLRGAPRP